jgi:hypothetical protein
MITQGTLTGGVLRQDDQRRVSQLRMTIESLHDLIWFARTTLNVSYHKTVTLPLVTPNLSK